METTSNFYVFTHPNTGRLQFINKNKIISGRIIESFRQSGNVFEEIHNKISVELSIEGQDLQTFDFIHDYQKRIAGSELDLQEKKRDPDVIAATIEARTFFYNIIDKPELIEIPDVTILVDGERFAEFENAAKTSRQQQIRTFILKDKRILKLLKLFESRAYTLKIFPENVHLYPSEVAPQHRSLQVIVFRIREIKTPESIEVDFLFNPR